jgi:hypothetical protein
MPTVGTCQDQIGARTMIRATDKQLGVWDQYRMMRGIAMDYGRICSVTSLHP